MNKVILSGNLTRDPEIRYTQSGKAMARMGIAVSRPFSKDQTDFFTLVAWEKQAEFCGRYLKKGSGVIVEGRVENDNYEDKNGVKHYGVRIQIDRIEFSGSKRQSGGDTEREDDFGGGNNSNDDDFDADVPF
ncbi:MAG: single-stranded DNA-binding protein [Selenomonadaceae bacterium]|nr:single-stranded DNA-binding protein [Selenomonadaceae bacterium]